MASFVLERIIRVLIFVYQTFSCTAGDASSTNEEESQHYFWIKFTSIVVFKLTVPSMHHTITINKHEVDKEACRGVLLSVVQRCTRRSVNSKHAEQIDA